MIKIEAFQLGLRRQHTIEKVRMEAVITAGAQTIARGDRQRLEAVRLH